MNFLALLLVLSLMSLSESAVNKGNITLDWDDFEAFKNSWNFRAHLGSVSVYGKPSDLDPKLISLDSNFTGNVWGAKVLETSFRFDYEYSSYPGPCLLDDITLDIRYYMDCSKNKAMLAVFPAKDGNYGEFAHLPCSSGIQWSEASMKLDVSYLSCTYPWMAIAIGQDLADVGDLILMDKITLRYSSRTLFGGEGIFRRNKNSILPTT